MYSLKDVKDYVEQEDIKFLRLAFCDVQGRQKNVSVMPEQLDRVDSNGISFDGSAIPGFTGVERSDLFLHPDYSTLAILPWRPAAGRVARIFCNICMPDGKPYAQDCRRLLQEAVSDAAKEGLSFRFASEMEFYLFETDEAGHPTRIPYDRAGYMDVAPDDKGENVRREICLTLCDMGILPESSHHEMGPGQNEIDFHYGDPVRAADTAITFSAAVRTVAARNGLYASFDPKPLRDEPGSGMHINISAQDAGGIDRTDAILGGILAHAAEMTLFFNPVRESYLRLGKDKAPCRIGWSVQNRSALVRIPAAAGAEKRLELRSPDCAANPYLVYVLLIRAALDGIRNNTAPGEPLDGNQFLEDTSAQASLPASLEEAVAKARESAFLTSVLPEGLLNWFLESAGRV